MELQSLSCMDRRIAYKLMSDGHIRAYQANTNDKSGAAEMMIYPPQLICPTISSAHAPKLLITDERILNALFRATKDARH